jgi:excisionase family DNA binding protein
MMAKIRRFRGRVLPTVEELVTEGAFPAQPVTRPAEPPVESQAYSVAEAAVLLHVASSTIYKCVAAGNIPSFRVGTTIRIPKSAPIFQNLESNGQEGFYADQST